MAYKILKGRKLMFMLKTPFDTVLEANKCLICSGKWTMFEPV